MIIKPKFQVYVYYDCTKCGAPYGEYRLSEATKLSSINVECTCCGNDQDTINPIVNFKTTYNNGPSNTVDGVTDDMVEVINMLESLGWGRVIAKQITLKAAREHDYSDTKELLNIALKALADE